MQITSVTVRKLYDANKMKAVCSVTFDNCLAVHDIKVIQTESKRFVAMPSRRNKDGAFSDIVHPITTEFRAEVEQAVINAYLAAVASEQEII